MSESDPNEPADRRVSELLLVRLDQHTDDKLEIIKESPERYWYFLRRLRLIAELSLVHTPEAVTALDIDRMVGLINEIYLHGLYSGCTGW